MPRSPRGYDGFVRPRKPINPVVPAAADATALFLVSLVGFSSHGLIGRVSVERFLATFLPFTAAYSLFALGLGVWRARPIGRGVDLWRPALAALLAAPLGALGRGLWLGAAPVPIFIGVMGAVSLAFVLTWRIGWRILGRRGPPGS